MAKIKRNNTADSPSLTYQDNVTFTFGQVHTPDADLPPFDVRFHFTPGPNSKFDTMPHFHIDKTEFLYVQQGSVRLTLNGVVRTLDSSAGQIEIPRWAPHRWEYLGETETIVLERTVPADGRKEAFFRNFVSLINDYGSMPPPLQAFRIFAEWDNYPIGTASWMTYLRTPIVGLTKTVGWVAGLAGYEAMYKEYTPKDLYEKLQASKS